MASQVKKIPIRRCLATNQPFPKKEMFRIVRTPDGNVIVDDTGKANGRGAYLSKSKEAIMLAKSKKLLDKHLEVAVGEEIYAQLLTKLGL